PYPYLPPTGQYPYPYPPYGAPPPPPYAPPPQPTAQPAAPEATADDDAPAAAEKKPRSSDQVNANAHHIGISVGLAGFFVPFRPTVGDGGSLDLDIVARLPVSTKNRFEVGAELRGILTSDTTHYVVGVPLRFMFGLGRNFEMGIGATPGYY